MQNILCTCGLIVVVFLTPLIQIARQSSCVGALVVRLRKGDELYTDVGSAFSVGPGLLVSAKHFILHPSGDPAWSLETAHFVMDRVVHGKLHNHYD